MSIERALTIANIILLLISGSKISLYQLGIATNKKGFKLKSCEQKIRRLLQNFPITSKTYAKAVIELFSVKSVELIIDRTNWMFGKVDINFLVLSFRWNCIAIPIYWIMLDNKGGNSNSEQRIAIIKWFTDNFNNITITNIYADREFPSVVFISWLLHQGINFIFRTKGSISASDGNRKVNLTKLFYALTVKTNISKTERHIRRIFGNRLYISIKTNNTRDPMFLISNRYYADPFIYYARRWNIETMFANFKAKSFNLESTHISQYHRLSALFTLMAISYCYCCKIGYIANSIKPIPNKKVKRSDNIYQCKPEFTFFKFGFYLLKNFFDNCLFNGAVIHKQLQQILNYPPNQSIPKRLRIYQFILNF